MRRHDIVRTQEPAEGCARAESPSEPQPSPPPDQPPPADPIIPPIRA